MSNQIKLYEINKILTDSLEMLDGIEDETLKEQGIEEINNQIKEMITTKSNALLATFRNYDVASECIDNEIKRLQELKKRNEKHKESFINYVDFNFKQLGIDEVETPFGKIKYKKLPLSIEVADEEVENLPLDCVRQKMTVSADKTAIKELYKKGITLPNVIYHENETKLTFN